MKISDLGYQYPKEDFDNRIATLVNSVSISLIARDVNNNIIGVLFGISDFSYWLFVTDLGVVRDCTNMGIGSSLIKKALEIAGGEDKIILYLCANDNAVGFYEKCGMKKASDIMEYNKAK